MQILMKCSVYAFHTCCVPLFCVTPQVVCAYHGWRFESDGTCSSIPQALDAKAAKTACASQRSCATAFPTIEAGGLLWVWPDASPGSEHGELVLWGGVCGVHVAACTVLLEPGFRVLVRED